MKLIIMFTMLNDTLYCFFSELSTKYSGYISLLTQLKRKIMQKKLLLIALFVVSVFACIHPVKKHAGGYFCWIGDSDSICSGLPQKVGEVFRVGYSSNGINFNNPSIKDSLEQTPLDLFSWQTFAALNWPSDDSGNPTGNIMDNNLTAQRVWERYQDPEEVFGNPQGQLVLHLNASKQASLKFFHMFSKSPRRLHPTDTVAQDVTEADGLPLIDKNGNFTLYEIKMNPIEVSFINNNKLTTYTGIFDYNNHGGVVFPVADSGKNTAGAIEIKAAWRVLTANDDASTYYTRTANIFVDSLHTTNKKPLMIQNVKVGLVGMHIIRGTSNLQSPQLIWSTFEHVNNAPDSGVAVPKGINWSYYNPACTDTVINKPPRLEKNYIWDTAQPYAKRYLNPGGYGTQVMRVNKIFRYTDTVNVNWRAKLKNTVWANYMLVGTQWELDDAPPFQGAPPSMSNTTMETYIQTNSCITCHTGANINYTAADKKYTIQTGMSYILPISATRPASTQGAEIPRK